MAILRVAVRRADGYNVVRIVSRWCLLFQLLLLAQAASERGADKGSSPAEKSGFAILWAVANSKARPFLKDGFDRELPGFGGHMDWLYCSLNFHL